MREVAATRGWPWRVDLLFNPDERIVSSERVAITSDSVVLNRVARWLNFKGYLIEKRLPNSWIIDLKTKEAGNARL
jgi:hypothetical protein